MLFLLDKQKINFIASEQHIFSLHNWPCLCGKAGQYIPIAILDFYLIINV